MSADTYTDEEKLAVREDPGLWFDTFAYVEDREKRLRRADDANNIQRQIFGVYRWCQENGEQCNIIGLKSRKEGLSTGATALAYHHLANHTATGVVIGTDGDTGDTLMAMILRYAEEDVFPWGTKLQHKPSENRAIFSHGSEVKRDTAVDPKAGRSSTVQVLIGTEVAHWPAAGVRSADETMLSILNSMPDVPNILRVVDSTANGTGGFFYDTYQGAVTFAERKAGKKGNGWIKVFEPWHSSPLRSVALTDAERAKVAETLSEREKAGRVAYGWTEGQIEWRRDTIKTKCGGSELKFDQEYPESEAVAFQTSGSPRFDIVGAARLLKMAEANHGKGHIGSIEGDPKERVRFLPDPQGWLWMIEEPRPGLSYSVIADVMTGEQSAGAKVRDKHAIGVLREGYFDERRTWHPCELVAAIHVEGGCEWDLSVLAPRVHALSTLYGRAMIVPEANNPGIALMELLKAAGAPVWQREDLDHVNLGKKIKKSGFQTNGKTKEFWVDAAAKAVRMAGVEGAEEFVCHYQPAAQQFGVFIRFLDGTCGAQRGQHDDWIAAIGIGLVVGCFTAYPLPDFRPSALGYERDMLQPVEAHAKGSGALG